MFGILDVDKKNDWLEYVLLLVYVYNCIRYSFIGYFFYFFMFGYILRFSIDVSLGVVFDNGGI